MIHHNNLKKILKFKKLLTVIIVILTALFSYFATKSYIDMGMYTLLPENDKDFQNFKKISSNYGGFDNLIIVLEGDDEEELKSNADTIALKMQELDEVVRDVDYKLPTDFIIEHLPLYLNEEDLSLFSTFLFDNEISVFDNPAKLAEFIHSIPADQEMKNSDILSLNNNFDNEELVKKLSDEYYFNNDKSKLMIFLRPTNPNHDMIYFQKMVSTVNDALKDLSKTHQIDNASYQLTGMAKMMEEQQTQLNTKIIIVSIIAYVLILLLFIISFRKLLAPILASIPVLIGILWTLGINQMVIGRLNIITSIFGAILLGLGIDFSIHFITKVLKELDKGKSIKEGLFEVYGSTMQGITVGAITTAVAFYILMLTDFRGLSELGFIAGTGILLCYISTYVLLPIMIVGLQKYLKSNKIKEDKIFKSFTINLFKYKYIVVILFILSIGFVFSKGLNIQFNYNSFSLIPNIESVKLQKQLIKEYDNSFEYSIISSDSLEEARGYYKDLENTDIYSLIDSPVHYISENQEEKINLLSSLSFNSDDTMSEVNFTEIILDPNLKTNLINLHDNGTDEEKLYASEMLAIINDVNAFSDNKLKQLNHNINLIMNIMREGIINVLNDGTININDLPETIKNKYIGQDGTIATYVYGKQNMWEEAPMKKTTSVLKDINEDTSGTPFMWVKLVEYLKNDLLDSTLYVFLALFLIVFIKFRKLKTVILSLVPVLVGLILLIGFMSFMGIKFNVANIVALPLILGIGIDDGIHMMQEYIHSKNIKEVMSHSGKAVLITSLTSMIGFGSLVFVGDPMVSGIGELLFLGVLFCLLASIFLLPILMSLFMKQKEV